MNINEASELTGLSKDMIRFYEKQGLIYPRRNNENNYRSYDQTDLNLLVLIKQYSALGIELKVIQSLINDYNIDHALDSFNQQVEKLEFDAYWAKARYLNAKLYQKILMMVKDNISYDIGKRNQTYYYPIESFQSHYSYNIIHIYSGISLPLFIIHAQDIDRQLYPNHTGMLIPYPHPNNKLEYTKISSHTYFRFIVDIDKSNPLSNKEINPLIKIINNNGYDIQGMIHVYQIYPTSKENQMNKLCIEFNVYCKKKFKSTK